jgi:hypothetical protein
MIASYSASCRSSSRTARAPKRQPRAANRCNVSVVDVSKSVQKFQVTSGDRPWSASSQEDRWQGSSRLSSHRRGRKRLRFCSDRDLVDGGLERLSSHFLPKRDSCGSIFYLRVGMDARSGLSRPNPTSMALTYNHFARRINGYEPIKKVPNDISIRRSRRLHFQH